VNDRATLLPLTTIPLRQQLSGIKISVISTPVLLIIPDCLSIILALVYTTMEKDPLVCRRLYVVMWIADDHKYPHLADLIVACPLQAGPLYTTFKDLSLCEYPEASNTTYADSVAVEWRDLRVLELPGTGWCAIIGHKRQEVSRPNQ
jgi:hypothetical protein